MKRVLCIWLPNWPIQRLVVAQPELKGTILVLHARDPRRGECVVACSSWARRRGVRIGMPVAEAAALSADQPHARRPHVGSHEAAAWIQPHDAGRDREALEQLAQWCEQFSPAVGMDDLQTPAGLLLDVTGLGRLFGGEWSLATRVARALRERGYWAHVALADTIGAAWALARFGSAANVDRADQPADDKRPATSGQEQGRGKEQKGGLSFPEPIVIPPGRDNAQAILSPLPIESLRLPATTIELLQRLGVERIVQLLALPREGLAARLGEDVLKRLDQALGSSDEMLVSYHGPQRFQADWTLEHATDRQQVILQVVEHLSHHLAGLLQAQDQGAVQIRCQLRCQTGHPLQMEIGFFRPTACADHFCQLLQMQLDSCRLPGPVAAVDLEVIHTARLSQQQREMWNDRTADHPEQLAILVDRLSSRLGPSAVLAARLRAGALPEDAYIVLPLTGPESSTARLNASSGHRLPPRPGQRPVLLFRTPLQVEVVCVAPDGPPIWFHHRGSKQQVGRHWGPERIETSWWQGPCIRRDYYQVECTSGSRFWLFRRLDDQTWFLQG